MCFCLRHVAKLEELFFATSSKEEEEEERNLAAPLTEPGKGTVRNCFLIV